MSLQAYETRRARRGGLTQSDFLFEMQQSGFRVIATTLPQAPRLAFVHIATGGTRYEVMEREPYHVALARLRGLI